MCRPGSTHQSGCQRPPYPRVRVAHRVGAAWGGTSVVRCVSAAWGGASARRRCAVSAPPGVLSPAARDTLTLVSIDTWTLLDTFGHFWTLSTRPTLVSIDTLRHNSDTTPTLPRHTPTRVGPIQTVYTRVTCQLVSSVERRCRAQFEQRLTRLACVLVRVCLRVLAWLPKNPPTFGQHFPSDPLGFS